VPRPSVRNHRFQTALADAGLRCGDVGEKVDADMKTVQRWLYEGRVPHRKTALRVGQLLGVDPVWLWPTIGAPMSSADLVCVYTDIGDVPDRLWQHMCDTARTGIDIATASVPVLPGEGVAESLAHQVKAGVTVRLCLSPAITSPTTLDGIALRRSRHPAMPAIFRFDTVMLVWLAGAAPVTLSLGPVLRLVRIEEHGLFNLYERIFEALWSTATPT